MDVVGLVCAVLVATVLAVSGAAKLLDRPGTTDAVAALGVPGPLVRAVALLLAPVELALAVLLLLPATGRTAAAAAAVLLLTFTGVVVANLLAGRRPRCGCFGGLGSSDVSWQTVLRNAALVLAATVAAAQRSDLSPLPVLLGVGLAAGLLGSEHMLSRRAVDRSAAEQAEKLEAQLTSHVELGAAPGFTLPDLHGRLTALEDLLAGGRPVLLAFLTTSCGTCRALLPDLERWHRRYAAQVTVAAVVHAEADRVREVLGTPEAMPLLPSPDGAVATAYDVAGTPCAALVDPDGRLAAPPGCGTTAVRRLLSLVLDHDSGADRPAPETVDLDSRLIPAPTAVREDRDDAALVLRDDVTGGSLSLDASGRVVWQCLDGGSLEQIATDIADAFGAERDVVAGDVLRVARACAAAGLLVDATRQPVP